MGVEVLKEAVPTLHCTYHPGRETVLRCNRCGKPICYECAIRTPVGYRCRECVRQQRSVYFNARSYDLPIAAAVGLVAAAILGAVAFVLLGFLGFFRLFGAIFGGPILGGMVAEAIRYSVGRRRAEHLNQVAAGVTALGVLLAVLLLAAGPSARAALFSLPLLISRWDMLLLAVLAASTAYARLQ